MRKSFVTIGEGIELFFAVLGMLIYLLFHRGDDELDPYL